MKEVDIQKEVQIEASKAGVTLFRNNIGSYKNSQGYYIKYGVCNPGGSDLIGFTKIRINENMIGKEIAVFTAIEIKTEKGRLTKEQEGFINFVNQNGGVSFVAKSKNKFLELLDAFRKKLRCL